MSLTLVASALGSQCLTHRTAACTPKADLRATSAVCQNRSFHRPSISMRPVHGRRCPGPIEDGGLGPVGPHVEREIAAIGRGKPVGPLGRIGWLVGLDVERERAIL